VIFGVGADVPVPTVNWSKSGLLAFCAKLQIPCHLGDFAGFDREVCRRAVAENGRETCEIIEENRRMTLGHTRLTTFPCHLGDCAGFDREVCRRAVAENRRETCEIIEENRRMMLGHNRLTTFPPKQPGLWSQADLPALIQRWSTRTSLASPAPAIHRGYGRSDAGLPLSLHRQRVMIYAPILTAAVLRHVSVQLF
jgi:hypothetical protein